MKPTIGRIVHYTTAQLEVHAGFITKVRPLEGVELHQRVSVFPIEEKAYAVSLRVFSEDSERIVFDAPFTNAKPGTNEACGHWTWPPRE